VRRRRISSRSPSRSPRRSEAAAPPPSPVAQATLAPPDAAGADLIGQQMRKIDQLEAENKKLKSAIAALAA
jgi:hypothetical protein